ncbi:MAG: chorismate synthase [Bacteroidales bacterium]|nr:chorismate synthase [Bacteroidales bacterium]
MNSTGTLVRLATFGESHGPAMGGVLDGLPSRVYIDPEEIQRVLDRRRPGASPLTSQRMEPDRVELLSGISADGLTLGTPIGFIIRNTDQRSGDYAERFRPNHADFTYRTKYGINAYAGGGRASARETVNWVVGGALCREWLKTLGVKISATFEETNSVEEARNAGDSTGGIVHCVIEGLPVGLGEPVFDKLHARLAEAMMGINAAHAFEYGDGMAMAAMHGSECLDLFNTSGEDPTCLSNHNGGVLGGISNGMPVNFTVYFKPTPTLMREVPGMNPDGSPCAIPAKGRHDPCVAIRAVPVVEARAWMVIADMWRMAGL